MSDQALRNAEIQRNQIIERRKALSLEASELDTKLSAVEMFIRQWHAFADDKPVENVNVTTTTFLDIPSASVASMAGAPKPKNSRKEIVAAETRKVIEE